MERWFPLAEGDRRGFLALDKACEVYAVPKCIGIKTKDVRGRQADQDKLLSVDEASVRYLSLESDGA